MGIFFKKELEPSWYTQKNMQSIFALHSSLSYTSKHCKEKKKNLIKNQK